MKGWYVAVGNKPFLKSYNNSFLNFTFPALHEIQNALNEAGLGDKIKAIMSLNADVTSLQRIIMFHLQEYLGPIYQWSHYTDSSISQQEWLGFGDLPILVGEVGWPTEGDKNANTGNALRFYNGLLPRLAANRGTPRRPGYIEVYLFGFIDEDAKSIAPGNLERHWGTFRCDGQPKFAMDLSGQNQNKFLVGTQNVNYLAHRWCMFNPDAKDLSKTSR
ncbi:hypothetical protein JHK87_053200 [Glycine soja]|nr:hypothetical protein JHK87_053200 [Glycine soja]